MGALRRAALAVGLAAAAVAAVLVLRILAADSTGGGTGFAYHKMLADPDDYADGPYTEEFEMAAGSYQFRFVPNGDSPRTLSIGISGESFSFYEDFELEGTLHKTPISEYYTWDYSGRKGFVLGEGQGLEISINPNGNVLGAVSVMIEGA